MCYVANHPSQMISLQKNTLNIYKQNENSNPTFATLLIFFIPTPHKAISNENNDATYQYFKKILIIFLGYFHIRIKWQQ